MNNWRLQKLKLFTGALNPIKTIDLLKINIYSFNYFL